MCLRRDIDKLLLEEEEIFPFGVLGKTHRKDIIWAKFARVELAGLG